MGFFSLISQIRLKSINLIKTSDKEAGLELGNGVFQSDFSDQIKIYKAN